MSSQIGTAAATPYVTATYYQPDGGIYTQSLANGKLALTNTENERLQPSGITAKDGTGNVLLGLGYNYNPNNDSTKNNGNLWQQTISRYQVGSWTQTYGYTELGGVGANRLTNAAETGTGSWSQAFLFDAAGNRWVPTVSGLSTTLETAADQGWYNVSGQTSNRIKGWGYDAAGNVTSVTGMTRAFSFDAENRMISATVNGTTTLFSYDSEGRRVMKVKCPAAMLSCTAGTTGAVWTAFVYDPAGNLAQEYGSGAAAYSGTQYLVTDALGSTRLVTDGNGVVSRCYDYLPFGEEIPAGTGGRPTGGCFGAATGPPPGTADVVSEKFNGQERDAETGLDNFIARYFSGAQGRFGSADDPLAGQDAGDPQSWNLFSFGLNNPLKYTDPSGHEPQCTAPGGCVTVNGGSVGTVDPYPTDIGAWFLFRLGASLTLQFPKRAWDNTLTVADLTLQWASRPRDTNCMAGYMASGTGMGAGVGIMGLAGGLTVAVTLPTAVGLGGASGWVSGMYNCTTGGGGGAGSPHSEYTDTTRRSAVRNVKTNVTPDEFGKNLEANGFAKSTNGSITSYTKGNIQYDLYPVRSSNGTPGAQMKVNGEVTLKFSLQR